MIYGLEDGAVERIRNVLARYPQVDKALIYGSRALGTNRPGSDIDLALFGNSLDLHLVNRISNDLDDLMLPWEFDLSIYHQIDNPALIDHIQRVGRLFYQRT